MPDIILDNVTINQPVADIAALNAIPTASLVEGVVCEVNDKKSQYRWNGSAWEPNEVDINALTAAGAITDPDELMISQGGINAKAAISDLKNKFTEPSLLDSGTPAGTDLVTAETAGFILEKRSFDEIKAFVHDHSSGFSIGIPDAEVDGIGTNPNTYATLAEAVAASKGWIHVKVATTETQSCVLQLNTVVSFGPGGSMSFGQFQIDRGNDYSLAFFGLSHYSNYITYSPASPDSPLITHAAGGGSLRTIPFYNISTINQGSFANTPLVEEDEGSIVWINSLARGGNADNAGLVFSGAQARSYGLKITQGGTAGTNAIKVKNGSKDHESWEILCGSSLETDVIVDIDEANAVVSNIVLTDQYTGTINFTGNLNNVHAIDDGINGNTWHIEMKGTRPKLTNANVKNLTINATATSARVFNSTCVNEIVNAGSFAERAGNDDNIGNDYHSGGGGSTHDIYDAFVGSGEKYSTVVDALNDLSGTEKYICVTSNTTDDTNYSLSDGEKIFIKLMSGVTWQYNGASILGTTLTANAYLETEFDNGAKITNSGNESILIDGSLNSFVNWVHRGGEIDLGSNVLDVRGKMEIYNAIIRMGNTAAQTFKGSANNCILSNVVIVGGGSTCSSGFAHRGGMLNNIRITGTWASNASVLTYNSDLGTNAAMISDVLFNIVDNFRVDLRGTLANYTNIGAAGPTIVQANTASRVIQGAFDYLSVSFASSPVATLPEYIYQCDTTAGNITLQLPDPTLHTDREVWAIKTDVSAGTVTATTSVGTIIGSAVLTTQYDTMKLRSNGASWIVWK